MNAQSLPDLNIMYKELNVQFFDGKLPIVSCVWNARLSKSFGRTKYKKDRKTKKYGVTLIDIQVGLSTQHLHKTMIHEMCHVWAIELFQSTGHSKIFWRKMKQCGYPDGHTFEDGIEQDKWQIIQPNVWRIQQTVYFDAEDVVWKGRILRINKRTVTIRTQSPRIAKWRVSPGALRIKP